MSSKLKLSKKTSEKLDYLAENLKIRRNIICRMAMAVSLNLENPPSTNFEDSLGQEFNKPTILGTDEPLFSALVTQHFGKNLTLTHLRDSVS